jgi:SOS response regulatory protein OraA/RecX
MPNQPVRGLVLDAEQLIKNANDNIENNIDILCPEHVGLCSQNILSQLRNLIDAFALLKWYKDGNDEPTDNGRERTRKAMNNLKSSGRDYKALVKIYDYLEKIASHFTQDQFASEVLLKKYEGLLQDIKDVAKKQFGIDILNNLDSFPFDINDDLKEYYHLVFQEMKKSPHGNGGKTNIFYVEHERRRHGDKGEVFYEYIFTPASDKRTKFDRLTVFSLAKINCSHAIKCSFEEKIVSISGINARITLLNDYSVSIRPCEIKLFANLECFQINNLDRSSAGYSQLMSFLTYHQCSLYNLIVSDDLDENIKEMQGNDKNNQIYDFLRYTKEKLNQKQLGFKTLTYLLYIFKHDTMKSQKVKFLEECLGATNLNNGCRHFEAFPFSFSLLKHNPRLEDLTDCLSDYCTQDQLLKRRLVINTENQKQLFTPLEELNKYYLTDDLIENYNAKLTDDTKYTALEKTPDSKYVYIKNYVDDTQYVLNVLMSKTRSGYSDYSRLANEYLNSHRSLDIDEDKIELLKSAFINSSVVSINGAAGTGKTTVIKHLSEILSQDKILYLSETNSSVQNLRRRVGLSSNRESGDFRTIDTFIKNDRIDWTIYNTLVVDECSTVSNYEMKRVLKKKAFTRIVLVGDEEQIESIKFGNWFGIFNIRLGNAAHNLSMNHRTQDNNLRYLWDLTRSYSDNLEDIVSATYLKELNNELFTKGPLEEEIILCLNYDGLYGINNINRYMQELNAGTSASWNVWTFKVGDRILFNESFYFRDYFYNNQKGRIESIEEREAEVIFGVAIQKEKGNNYASSDYIQYVSSENDPEYDHYKITISKKDDEDDEETSKVKIVPFQLGYAISIHKSQGLEYDSVKIVITKEVEESISHNIFYTAITRCKKQLQIFTDKSSLHKIIDSFTKNNYINDSCILQQIERSRK